MWDHLVSGSRTDLPCDWLICRKGVCEEISGAYEKTDTNGKFRYHKASKCSTIAPKQHAYLPQLFFLLFHSLCPSP